MKRFRYAPPLILQPNLSFNPHSFLFFLSGANVDASSDVTRATALHVAAQASSSPLTLSPKPNQKTPTLPPSLARSSVTPSVAACCLLLEPIALLSMRLGILQRTLR